MPSARLFSKLIARDVPGTVARYAQILGDNGISISGVLQHEDHKVGTDVGSFKVKDIADIESEIKKDGIKVAMIATPSDHAQEVADQLVSAGVMAILNYAPINLNVSENVRVQYIDPVIHLQRMTYYL